MISVKAEELAPFPRKKTLNDAGTPEAAALAQDVGGGQISILRFHRMNLRL